jgi:hypothetical protein
MKASSAEALSQRFSQAFILDLEHAVKGRIS